MRASLVGSNRHSMWLRSITSAPGISPSSRRCHPGRVSTSSAPRSSTARAASSGVTRSEPRARGGEEIVDAPGHARIIAVRRVPSERRARARSACLRERAAAGGVEVHRHQRRRVHVHARRRRGGGVHHAVHVTRDRRPGRCRRRGAAPGGTRPRGASTSRAARPRRRRAHRSNHRGRGGRRPGTSPTR